MIEPCPFCNSSSIKLKSYEVKSISGSYFEHAYVCQNCGAQGPNSLGVSGAGEMWNLRRQFNYLKVEFDYLKARLEAVISDAVQDIEFLKQKTQALTYQRSKLLMALQAIEWAQTPCACNYRFCPWCGNRKSDGHRHDCQRQVALEISERKDRDGNLLG